MSDQGSARRQPSDSSTNGLSLKCFFDNDLLNRCCHVARGIGGAHAPAKEEENAVRVEAHGVLCGKRL